MTTCGKGPVLKGHGFSRAVNASKSTRALAPEGWFPGILLAVLPFSATRTTPSPATRRKAMKTHNAAKLAVF
jgi:hypothetical protein